jgi:hypothetical protein
VAAAEAGGKSDGVGDWVLGSVEAAAMGVAGEESDMIGDWEVGKAVDEESNTFED